MKSRFGRLMVLATVIGAGQGAAMAGDSACQVTEIAPGVKMRAANCPTLIGRPAALQPNRVENALQPPAGLYRYSDVEMRITPPRSSGAAIGGGPGPRRP